MLWVYRYTVGIAALKFFKRRMLFIKKLRKQTIDKHVGGTGVYLAKK